MRFLVTISTVLQISSAVRLPSYLPCTEAAQDAESDSESVDVALLCSHGSRTRAKKFQSFLETNAILPMSLGLFCGLAVEHGTSGPS